MKCLTRRGETTAPGSAVPRQSDSPIWRDSAFRRYCAAVALSIGGTQIALLAIPLVAVLALDAGPAEVGILGAIGTAAFLVFGLPAGTWLDRVRRRPVMIVADLLRSLLMASVPVAWLLHALTMDHLYVMAFLNGVCSVFFDIGAQSHLPGLVGRDRLVPANSILASWNAGATIAGPGAASMLLRLLGAPIALAINAGLYAGSALGLMFVGRPEPRPDEGEGPALIRRMIEGTAFVARQPTLVAIAAYGAATNLFIKMGIVAMPLVFVRLLDLDETALGLFFTAGGIGVFLGTATAKLVANRWGCGRCLWLMNLVLLPVGLMVPFINRGPALMLATVGWFSFTYREGISNVITVSIRQRLTPDEYLSRMNATMRVFITGSLTIGAALTGLIGEVYGLRAVLWVSAIGLSLAWLPLFFSPLRTARAMPRYQAHQDGEEPD